MSTYAIRLVRLEDRADRHDQLHDLEDKEREKAADRRRLWTLAIVSAATGPVIATLWPH